MSQDPLCHNRYRRRCPKCSPVQAQVLYAIRAPKITQVKELYNRVCNIARGAALMTETTVEIRQVAAYSNLISSKILADHMNAYLEKLGPITYTEEEYAYAQKFQQSLSDQDKNQLPTIARDYFGPKAAEVMKQPIFEPMAYQNLYSDLKYSTDVGDVSWLVPTVHLNIPTFAARNRPPLLARQQPRVNLQSPTKECSMPPGSCSHGHRLPAKTRVSK